MIPSFRISYTISPRMSAVGLPGSRHIGLTENRTLRRLCGLSVGEESDDEEELHDVQESLGQEPHG